MSALLLRRRCHHRRPGGSPSSRGRRSGGSSARSGLLSRSLGDRWDARPLFPRPVARTLAQSAGAVEHRAARAALRSRRRWRRPPGSGRRPRSWPGRGSASAAQSARGVSDPLDDGQDGVDAEREERRRGWRRRRVASGSLRARPSMMNRPRPPYDRTAPMVAVAMTCRVAVRKPPTMTAIESGSSIRRRIWRSRHAHARARPRSGRDRRPAGPRRRRPGSAGWRAAAWPGRSG